MTKIKVKFPKGIQKVHIPFMPNIDSYDQLYRQIERIEYPKSATRIEASIKVSIDLRHGTTSYQLSQVTVHK